MDIVYSGPSSRFVGSIGECGVGGEVSCARENKGNECNVWGEVGEWLLHLIVPEGKLDLWDCGKDKGKNE